MNDDTKFFICDCHSYKHQMFFWWNKEDQQLYATIHLTTHRNFFKRLCVAIKYTFGYKSNFGAWDEFIFKTTDKDELCKFLNEHK